MLVCRHAGGAVMPSSPHRSALPERPDGHPQRKRRGERGFIGTPPGMRGKPLARVQRRSYIRARCFDALRHSRSPRRSADIVRFVAAGP
jgi:hypothetical protein